MFVSCSINFLHLVVIAINRTVETCAGCAALSGLQVIMSSKAATKLLLQNKPCKLSDAADAC